MTEAVDRLMEEGEASFVGARDGQVVVDMLAQTVAQTPHGMGYVEPAPMSAEDRAFIEEALRNRRGFEEQAHRDFELAGSRLVFRGEPRHDASPIPKTSKRKNGNQGKKRR